MSESHSAAKPALEGLRVVDFSDYRTGAQASQLLADFGAEVVHVEPKGGSALRSEAAWALWGRGKRSLQLDLNDPADLAVAQRLASGADVVIETFRPGVADRLGIGYDHLSQTNPGLVYASITGFGSVGPLADLQGYEGIVFAKLGVLWTLSGLSDRPGPAMPSAAYASYPASQLALQGIFAALYERQTSGVGQRIETSLMQALTVHDTFAWFARVMASRFSEGFVQKPRIVDGVPTGGLSFRLLIALTADGHWLQFSQTSPRLFRAMMKMFELDWMFSDPKWASAPDFDEAAQRSEFWDLLLGKVRSKTLAEWRQGFEEHPDVWGELFRKDDELLEHPQMIWNRMVAHTSHPEFGQVRMPGPLAHLTETPARIDRPAPRLGEHDARLREEAATATARPAKASGAPKNGARPLDGVTVVELGTYYAGPYGATLLAELGARVIKLEEPEGDPHRNMLPFPEISGLKVLQGKECVGVDLRSDQGRAIAHRVIAKADIVLQSFRAGVAERLGLDPKTIRALNPDIVYLSAPGYGVDGPCGRRPAFAPTIGAAAGLAWRNVGASIPEARDLTLDQIKPLANKLGDAVMGVGNSDGLSSVSVGTALMLGLLARQRGAGGQEMMTSMLSSTAHALSEVMVSYEGHPRTATAGADCAGFHALYRLYQASDAEDWVFLAAPTQKEWLRLTKVLEGIPSLASDPRFATPESRASHDAALTQALADIFPTKTGAEWESLMRAADVACVAVAKGPVEANFMGPGSLGEACDLVTTGHHPILDEVPRLKALVRFSRSSTVTGDAGLVGQHTHAVLSEFGYTEDEIASLAARSVVVLG